MTPTMIGASIGGVIGLANFGVLRAIAQRAERKTGTMQGATPQSKMLNMVAWLDLVLLPLVGGFVGSRF